MSDRPPRDDEDLEALLSELESTLSALRSELDEGGGRRRRRGPPRPPSVGELLRFTNDYTIPTVIATLQATIEALELLRRFLELAAGTDRGGGRVTSADRSRLTPLLSGAGERAASDASDALSQLRTALAEADLPEDEESRDLIEDARALSERIEERIAGSRGTVARERERERSEEAAADDAVVIDVTDGEDEPSTSDGKGDARGEDAGNEDDPEVDVEAELRSIKEQMGKAESPDGDGAPGDREGPRGQGGSGADDGAASTTTDADDGEPSDDADGRDGNDASDAE